jgi:hypothetical protein
MISKKTLFLSLMSLNAIVLLLGLNIKNIIENQFFWFAYQSAFETILVGLLFLLLINFFLLFFPEKIFQLWLHRIASWFLPISVILIWAGSGGNDYASLDRTSVSIILGVTLLIISVVFVFIQRFYYKVR